MTELRQKMIRAMELKNLSPRTQRAYLAAVKGLARHYRQSPTAIGKEMIEDYLLALKKTRASNSCGLVLTRILPAKIISTLFCGALCLGLPDQHHHEFKNHPGLD
jgi:hypothetical protein